jgi:hypothetical protein
MNRPLSHWISCLLLAAAAGCAQSPGVPTTPGVDTNVPTDVSVTGPATGTCNGKPVLKSTTWGEVFELTSADVNDGKVKSLEGKPPSLDILGSLEMSGPVCKVTMHLGVYDAQQNGADLHIDEMTLTGVREVVPKKCRK